MMIEDGCAHGVRSLEHLKDWVYIAVEKTANMKWMVENRKPMVMPDVNDFPEWIKIPETHWIRSYVGAPIVAMDCVIGLINLDSATPGFYNHTTAERLMSFA
ncbi:MAG: GAF domain-containing protein [Anaerolineaceae bacterium]|nr:GAF domain-containing protein [Anaerolineaceae bacterium]